VLESTTFPGTTEEVVLPMLEKSGLKVGRDIYLGFSPERVDPANKEYTTKNIPKVVGGVTELCTKKVASYYGKIFDNVHPVSSTHSAEMVKLLENTFRSVNIAMVNEFAIMCDKLGLNVWEIIEAASTKPFGFMPFYPGPGLGGHCIPIDPYYLSWKLRSLDYHAQFIDLASDINSYMPNYVVSKIGDILNKQGKPLKDSLIYIIGVAYKKDVADLRESPALLIMKLLQERDAKIKYNDPYFNEINHDGISMKGTLLTKSTLRKADCVVVITNHSSYDYKFICDNARIVFDTRNATKKVKSNTPIYKL
jgi:UDP-N-acetyl-D-glucosamine dehydrogenase